MGVLAPPLLCHEVAHAEVMPPPPPPPPPHPHTCQLCFCYLWVSTMTLMETIAFGNLEIWSLRKDF